MATFKSVVLCRRPPNHAFEGSAQQRPAVGFPPRFARRRPLNANVSLQRVPVAQVRPCVVQRSEGERILSERIGMQMEAAP